MEDRFSAVEETDNLCFLCLQPASFLCPICSIPYCGTECFAVHQTKQGYCYPFRVLQKPGVGRYLVATRDIEPLELIIEDEPAVFGPNHDTGPACMECLLPTDGSFLCPKCSLPLCGPDCLDGPYHKPECEVFSKPLPTGFEFRVELNREIPEGAVQVNSPEYCCIAPLRALEMKKHNPEMWRRFLLLMDHDEERKLETDYQEMFQVNVINFLQNICGLEYDKDEIFRILGIIRTNALQVQDPNMKLHGVSGRAVYPTLSYLSHSCICNARYSQSPNPKDRSIKVRAQRKILKGEEISIQYLSFMYGHIKRKGTIKNFWFFDCNCDRCTDPTELNSYMSAMKCSDCENGNLLPENPMEIETCQWSCDQCQHRQSGESIKDYIDYCDEMLCNPTSSVLTVARYEKILQEFSQRLHPNHYLVMTVKKYLADMYPRNDQEKMHLKIQYFEEFLDVIGKVDPGFTAWRGQVLFDMHRPMMLQANLAYGKGEMKKDEFMQTLKKISSNLEESVKCLLPEAEGTKEAFICSLAQKALNGIKEVIFFSDFL